MTDVGTDLFQIGHNHYLVLVYRYSGFPFVEKLTKLSTAAVIKILTSWFNTFGWPERLEKVNENTNEFSSRLLDFRNTPNISGKSPAQMFFGRRLRDRLPHLPGANDLQVSDAKDGANNRKMIMEQQENQYGTSLQPLSTNQKVLVQNPITKSWDDQGIITKMRPLGRSYEILMDSGKTILRNRTLLRPINNTPKEIPTPNSTVKHSHQQPPALRRSERLSNKKN